MRSLRTIVLAALAAAALTLALAACGSSKKGASASGSSGAPAGVINPATESLTGGKRGGVLNDLQNEDFEHLDPGQSYFQLDYAIQSRSEEHTSELQSQFHLVCRLLLEKKKRAELTRRDAARRAAR